MDIRTYEAETDHLAAIRIWRECGWLEDEDDDKQLAPFLEDAHALVAVTESGPEALVSIHDGTLRHSTTDLAMAAVTSVTTSRVGRKQGLAHAALTQALRDATDRGDAVAALGMFEQGFYDTFGFGTGSEELVYRLDPAHLDPSLPYRAPLRLTVDDAAGMAEALVRQDRTHGAATIPSAGMRRAEMGWTENGFGLGYRDATGAVTHFIWCRANGEHGPYTVTMWAWRDTQQLRELLGLLRSLGDQVRTVTIYEPAQLQMAALVRYPGRLLTTRTTGEHRYEVKASTWWQARILDMATCVAALPPSDDLQFDLHITDPLEAAGLTEVAGSWVVRLGDAPTAERGSGGGASLTMSVNSFTRLWLGVREPSVVCATDGVQADPEFLAALDSALRLPRPHISLDF